MQTARYARIIFPGPPFASALPVPINNPLPMLQPKEMTYHGKLACNRKAQLVLTWTCLGVKDRCRLPRLSLSPTLTLMVGSRLTFFSAEGVCDFSSSLMMEEVEGHVDEDVQSNQ
jgi:hypothetical protein